MSELQAAFLYPQLLEYEQINAGRLKIWNIYNSMLPNHFAEEMLPFVPEKCTHNAHLFYLMLKSEVQRKKLIQYLQKSGIDTFFHYIPLHNSPIWKGKHMQLPITEKVASTILRLPLFYELSVDEVIFITEKIREFWRNENY